MLPVLRYVSPVTASSSFNKSIVSRPRSFTMQSFVAWHQDNYLKEVLNSTYVDVCWLVYEKHESGKRVVLFSHCH